MKFRKKPIEVEARQFPDDGPGQIGISNWVEENGGEFYLYDGYVQRDIKTKTGVDWNWSGGFIKTLEGDMKVGIGDWVVKGVVEEFYPVRNDIFEKTYEPVSQGDGR